MTNQKLAQVAVALIDAKTAFFQKTDRQHYVDLPVLLQAVQLVMQGMIFAESCNNESFDRAVDSLKAVVKASANTQFIALCKDSYPALAQALLDMAHNATDTKEGKVVEEVTGFGTKDRFLGPEALEILYATFGTSSPSQNPYTGRIFIRDNEGQLVGLPKLTAVIHQ